MKKVNIAFLLIFSIQLISAQNSNYRINRIVIDPGHGGHDPGTHGKLYKEKDVALDIALKLGKYINDNNPNVEIIFTRSSDTFIPLFQRIGKANKAKADLFVSIHCNSSPKTEVKGSETYVMGLHRAEENLAVAQRENEVILLENDYESNYEGFDPNSPVGHIVLSSFQDSYLSQSLDVAAGIEDQLKHEGYTTSRGVKQAGFAVLRRATMPSILIETGFLSNSSEEKYLGSEKGKNEISHAIYRALNPYLNHKISTTPAFKDPSSQSAPVVIKEMRPKGSKTFHVQFVALKSKLDDRRIESISKIGKIKVVESNGFFKYQIEDLPTLEKAKHVKEKLGDLGFKGSFIVQD